MALMGALTDFYKSQPVVPKPPSGGDLPSYKTGTVTQPTTPGINTGTVGAPTQPAQVNPTLPTGTNPRTGMPLMPALPFMPAKPAAWAPKAVSEPATPGSKGPAAPAVPLYGSDTAAKLKSWYEGIIGGDSQAFNPALLGSMRARIHDAATGQADAAIDQAKGDAIRRGIFRSGLPTDAILQARASAGANETKALGNLESEAAQSNANQKMTALQALQAALSSDRDFQLKDFMAHKPTPGPNYDDELYNILGNIDEPGF